MLPKRSIVCAIKSSTWSISRMLIGTTKTSAPISRSSVDVSSRFCSFQLAITTRAPRRAKARAVRRPIPRPPPVTSAVRPWKNPLEKVDNGSRSTSMSGPAHSHFAISGCEHHT